MSKITNDSLTQSGTGCCTHMVTVGIKELTSALKNINHNDMGTSCSVKIYSGGGLYDSAWPGAGFGGAGI